MKTTKQHSEYWKNRKIDWKTQYLDTWNHPHRQFIVWALQTFHWGSIWEIGCGAGANLVRLVQSLPPDSLPNHAIGGQDINPDAIALAQKTLPGGLFNVSSFEQVFQSDNGTDVILSDAALIYVGPFKIKKQLKEMMRVTRSKIVLCEFYSSSWFQRMSLRIKTGYNAYDYPKLLKELGCFDIQIVKLPKEAWDGYPWQPFGHIIIASVPRK